MTNAISAPGAANARSREGALAGELPKDADSVRRLDEDPQLRTRVAAALGVNIAQVYLAKSRVAALVKKEVRRLERETT